MLGEVLGTQGGELGGGWVCRSFGDWSYPLCGGKIETDNRKQLPQQVRGWLDIMDGEEIQK